MAKVKNYVIKVPYRSTREEGGKEVSRVFHTDDIVTGKETVRDGVMTGIMAHGVWPIPKKNIRPVKTTPTDAVSERQEEMHHAADGDVSIPQSGPAPKQNAAPAAEHSSPASEPEESKGASKADPIKKIEETQIVKKVVDKSHGTVKGVLWGGIAGVVLGFILKKPVAGAIIGMAIGGYAGYNWLTKEQIDNLTLLPKK